MENLGLIISTGLSIWCLGLSYIYIKLLRRFNSLTKDVKEENLIKVLERVLELEGANTKQIGKITNELAAIKANSVFYIQKVGFVRFNPFKETGGDQSFALSLLNKEDTGFVLTGLHTRDRTRVYVKPIKKGKCNHKLSTEEQKAIQLAK